MSETGFDWENDGCDATFGERVQNYKRQGFGSQASEGLATEEMLTEIHAMVRFLALSSLRSSLSTARSEGIREGLEMAARVADARRGRVPGNTKAFRAYQDACQHTAAAIRAKIGALETTP